MLAYIVRRLLFLPVVLFGITALLFALISTLGPDKSATHSCLMLNVDWSHHPENIWMIHLKMYLFSKPFRGSGCPSVI